MTAVVEESRGQPAEDAMTAKPAASGRDSKPLCGAQRRQADAKCRRPAGWGTDHVGFGKCKLHGGSTKNHRQSAQAMASEADARAMLARLGEPEPLGDPVEELLAIGAEAKSWLGALREQVSELHQLSKDDVALIDRVRAPVQLYGEAMDRTERVLVNLAKLGLDERMTRVREIQAVRLVDAVSAVLAHPSLGLTVELQRQARALLAAELVGRATSSPTALAKTQVIDAESQPVSLTSAGNGAPESES
jgi:hypothetical protein